MHRFYAFAVTLLAFPLLNCGLVPMMSQQPGTQDPSALPQTTSAGYGPSASRGPGAPGGPSSASPGSVESKSSGGQSSPTPTTVEVHSDCSKTTPLFYGDKPKFGGGTKSSIGSNTTTSAGRKSDGTLTVWIIDEHENGIASARVGPTTRRVEIDRSCRSITTR